MLSQQDQVDQAITYIEQLKERVEVLKRRKDELVAQGTGERSRYSKKVMTTCTLETPAVEVRELGSTLEVILISGLKKKYFTMQEVINILEEEGAQVVTAHFSTVCDKVCYTIHAQVINSFMHEFIISMKDDGKCLNLATKQCFSCYLMVVGENNEIRD